MLGWRGTLLPMLNANQFLLQAQNADGGWGYRKGGMSYVEPTAAVILAVSDENARNRARNFLLSNQHADGGWGIGAIDNESGWMTAWAVLALADSSEVVARGIEWLRVTQGLVITDESSRAQIQSLHEIDSALPAWPWQPGDGSWVHPTALAMLAMCKTGRRNDQRVRQGVAYLYNRAVQAGGWNVGNPAMLGKAIPATIHDTAIALLALRAAGEDAHQEQIARAFDFLKRSMPCSKISSELAWSIWAMREWGMETGDWLAQLNNLQLADASWQGNPFVTAIAILASTL
jgi:hypothetical protein